MHGYTSFGALDPETLVRHPEQLSDVVLPKLWTILNRAGIRTGIFNVPSTHPAEPIDGFMLSGFPAPTRTESLLQPAPLQGAFRQAFSDYDCNGSVEVAGFNTRSRRSAIIRRLETFVRMRLRALEWLLDREPVDFLWVVFETFDRIAHCAYAFLSPASALYDTEEGRETRGRVLELLQLQDQAIGRILERMGPSPTVMVVSDHGFAWTPRLFDLRGWLIAQGLMVPQPGTHLWQRMKAFGRSKAKQWGLSRFWQAMALIRGGLATAVDHERWTGATWDWSRSSTWLAAATEYGVRINLCGRYPWGIVPPEKEDEIVHRVTSAMRGLCDPETGEPIFPIVERRDAVYEGPYTTR